MTFIPAHQALEDLVLTKAEATRSARSRRSGRSRSTTGSVLAGARGARRLRREDAGARHRRGARAAAGRRAGRRRAPLRARALRPGAGLVRVESVPARRVGGLHPARGDGGRAGRGAGAEAALADALGGPGRRRARAGGLGVPAGDDAELLPYDAAATLDTRSASTGPGSSTTTSSRTSRRSSRRSSRPSPEDEDVHSAIERQLGDVGRKIHAGRSRNDQVAAAFRLYVAGGVRTRPRGIRGVLRRPCSTAPRRTPRRPCPVTRTCSGRPVTVGHHLLAWVEMLERDRRPLRASPPHRRCRRRSARARSRGRRCRCRRRPAATRNSLDAVADRDFALDYLYASRCCSRTCRESARSSFLGDEPVRLRPAAGARRDGSSMMPQKLNPDVAELVRGEAGTMIGRLTGLLAVVKGLPLAYDRDLQEDEPPVFAARHDVKLALGALLSSSTASTRPRPARGRVCRLLLRATDAAERLSPGACRSAMRTSRSPRQVRAGRRSTRLRSRRAASRLVRPRSLDAVAADRTACGGRASAGREFRHRLVTCPSRWPVVPGWTSLISERTSPAKRFPSQSRDMPVTVSRSSRPCPVRARPTRAARSVRSRARCRRRSGSACPSSPRSFVAQRDDGARHVRRLDPEAELVPPPVLST